MMTIALRELRSYFVTSTGYIIIGLYLLATGWVFTQTNLRNGEIASMRSVFGVGTWLLAFIAPAVTMRLFSEEFRLGTFETLLTSPLRSWQLVMGKFLGAMGFILIMLLPTTIYIVALETYGRPDFGEIGCGYLGMILAAAAYLASGLLASTLTASQPVAFLITVFFWITFSLATKHLPEELGADWSDLLFAMDPDLRLRDFVIGLIDSSNIAYFVGLCVLFLVAAVQMVNVRRWP